MDLIIKNFVSETALLGIVVCCNLKLTSKIVYIPSGVESVLIILLFFTSSSSWNKIMTMNSRRTR